MESVSGIANRKKDFLTGRPHYTVCTLALRRARPLRFISAGALLSGGQTLSRSALSSTTSASLPGVSVPTLCSRPAQCALDCSEFEHVAAGEQRGQVLRAGAPGSRYAGDRDDIRIVMRRAAFTPDGAGLTSKKARAERRGRGEHEIDHRT